MLRQIVLKTPAKINLSLDITGKLPNGYHTLRSVFQAVGIYDTLTLTRKAPDQPMTLSCNVPDVPCDARNLVWKAAQKLLGDTPCGVDLVLEKQIPAQAGMGGGSSDCAAALLGIRRLMKPDIDDQTLHAYAAALGADVPFFLHGGTVLCEGIGEVLHPLAPAPRRYLVLAKGNEGVSTPEGYRRLDAYGAELPCDTDNVLDALQKDADALFSVCGNHFDAVTDLAETDLIRDVMRQNGIRPVLCGSGAAVFGGCASAEQAEICAAALRAQQIPFVACAETVSSGVVTISERNDEDF